MQKPLSAFINAVPHTVTHQADADPVITGLVFDSRSVTPGALFFALPGVHTQGSAYIPSAIKAGAAAIVYQGELDAAALQAIQDCWAVAIRVDDARFSMAPLASAFYDNPSARLAVIGVTGTEGKSSTVAFIWQLLRLCGKKAGFISTVQYSLGDGAIDNPEHQTTPEAPIIQKQLYEMLTNGCEAAVLESSSHGLSPRTNRLGNVLFDAAVFMNVTHEHLEFHGTWEQYRDDKANLFRALDAHSHEKIINGKRVTVPAFGVVNADDPSADYFAQATRRDVRRFSYPEVRDTAGGIEFALPSGETVSAPTPGSFNAYNITAAIMTAHRLFGIPLGQLADAASRLTPIRGRMTAINQGQPFEVIIDYAHTPSSFQTIFPPLRGRAEGRIISLFGSGGERDLAKRPEQGKIAGRWSDVVILTDEDPRGEDSTELLAMIQTGCVEAGKTPGSEVHIIPDRPAAIRQAFAIAQAGDIVLLLGKSHENSIIYKDFIMPYDEFAEAGKALAELGFSQMK
ncbi:MAG: UDP-N-acetylmuramoyl-L-alanyl-D-glutamate--2,6-diaminopimelate ligase [Treponema sp.]|nr:UDP-N-acetylmuramoyl-L-alanyl-D-glutamate--2,6-diaminopimelate ligase [Treponema sp.]